MAYSGSTMSLHSAVLHSEVPHEEACELLGACELFAELSPAERSTLASTLSILYLAPRDEVTRCREEATFWGVVLQGRLHLKTDEDSACFLGAGALLGVTGLFHGGLRSYSLHSEGNSTLAVLTYAELDELREMHRPLADRVLSLLARAHLRRTHSTVDGARRRGTICAGMLASMSLAPPRADGCDVAEGAEAAEEAGVRALLRSHERLGWGERAVSLIGGTAEALYLRVGAQRSRVTGYADSSAASTPRQTPEMSGGGTEPSAGWGPPSDGSETLPPVVSLPTTAAVAVAEAAAAAAALAATALAAALAEVEAEAPDASGDEPLQGGKAELRVPSLLVAAAAGEAAAAGAALAGVLGEIGVQHDEAKRLLSFSREAYAEAKQFEGPLQLLDEVRDEMARAAASPAPLLPASRALLALLSHVVRALNVLNYRTPTDPPLAELELLRRLCMRLTLLLLLLRTSTCAEAAAAPPPPPPPPAGASTLCAEQLLERARTCPAHHVSLDGLVRHAAARLFWAARVGRCEAEVAWPRLLGAVHAEFGELSAEAIGEFRAALDPSRGGVVSIVDFGLLTDEIGIAGALHLAARLAETAAETSSLARKGSRAGGAAPPPDAPAGGGAEALSQAEQERLSRTVFIRGARQMQLELPSPLRTSLAVFGNVARAMALDDGVLVELELPREAEARAAKAAEKAGGREDGVRFHFCERRPWAKAHSAFSGQTTLSLALGADVSVVRTASGGGKASQHNSLAQLQRRKSLPGVSTREKVRKLLSVKPRELSELSAGGLRHGTLITELGPTHRWTPPPADPSQQLLKLRLAAARRASGLHVRVKEELALHAEALDGRTLLPVLAPPQHLEAVAERLLQAEAAEADAQLQALRQFVGGGVGGAGGRRGGDEASLTERDVELLEICEAQAKLAERVRRQSREAPSDQLGDEGECAAELGRLLQEYASFDAHVHLDEMSDILCAFEQRLAASMHEWSGAGVMMLPRVNASDKLRGGGGGGGGGALECEAEQDVTLLEATARADAEALQLLSLLHLSRGDDKDAAAHTSAPPDERAAVAPTSAPAAQLTKSPLPPAHLPFVRDHSSPRHDQSLLVSSEL